MPNNNPAWDTPLHHADNDEGYGLPWLAKPVWDTRDNTLYVCTDPSTPDPNTNGGGTYIAVGGTGFIAGPTTWTVDVIQGAHTFTYQSRTGRYKIIGGSILVGEFSVTLNDTGDLTTADDKVYIKAPQFGHGLFHIGTGLWVTPAGVRHPVALTYATVSGSRYFFMNADGASDGVGADPHVAFAANEQIHGQFMWIYDAAAV